MICCENFHKFVQACNETKKKTKKKEKKQARKKGAHVEIDTKAQNAQQLN